MMPSPLHDPEFLPFRLDLVGQRVLWVRLGQARRHAAAFLDERALPAEPEGGWLPLPAWLQAEPGTAMPADAIFHIGHCGSTLLARLLESWPQLQSLREPLPLRILAEAWPTRGQADARLSVDGAERLLQAAWAAWSRPLPPCTRSLVKATSSCNGLIGPLLDLHPAMRAVLLDMPLRPWLATLFKSADSVNDAASAAPERLRHLQACGFADGLALHAMSLPEQCAMGWLAERLRFGALAAGPHGARVLRVDFETLLEAPGPTLATIARHLGLDDGSVPVALASPVWGRYSKAQAHEYGPRDRRHDLELALQRNASGIAAAEAWLAAQARRHPEVAAVLARDA
ncbi:sulfotransferase [Marilutibacter chinensis]|uniref:Sulfotransferase n=1 Tax=Marilutibacter chinensis TaxID=2912247 RepID=A0ABS9HXH3_9GAMM|nr:sulfotransferase [Lysobacter chinensis]MCF7223584.1 sulfotransferase [Lysobacter chinensis]